MGANRSHGNMQPRACARWTLACALLMLLGGAGASDHTAECDFLANFYLKTQLRGPWSNVTGWDGPSANPDCCTWKGVTCRYPQRAVGQARPIVVRLSLHENGLSGEIPMDLQGMTGLEELDLSGNRFRGHIPENLPLFLRGQYLCDDRGGGQLATNAKYYAPCVNNGECGAGGVCRLFGGLRRLDLSNNELWGPIPETISAMWKTLTNLNLGMNRLEERIPVTIGALKQLTDLSLFYNMITGPIPPQLGLLVNLRFLNLSFNRLTGAVPAQLVNLARLEQLDLSQNSMRGVVPNKLGVLVSPPPRPCDRPGGTCLGATMANISLAGRATCEPGQLCMWYVSAYKQPCNPSVSDQTWNCQSCAPPWPSPGPEATGKLSADCFPNLPALPAPPVLSGDTKVYNSFPWAPAIPASVGVVGPGPKLRIIIMPRCTFQPQLYARRVEGS